MVEHAADGQSGGNTRNQSTRCRDRSGRSLAGAALTVGLVVVTSSLLGWILHLQLVAILEETWEGNGHTWTAEAGPVRGVLATFRSVGPLVGSFSALLSIALWPIGTAVLAALSVLLGGEGRFERLLVGTGFGYVPLLVANLAAILVLSVTPPSGEISVVDRGHDAAGVLLTIEDAGAKLRQAPLLVAIRTVLLLAHGCMYALWVLIVKEVEQLKPLVATVVVVLAVILMQGVPWLVRALWFSCSACG